MPTCLLIGACYPTPWHDHLHRATLVRNRTTARTAACSASSSPITGPATSRLTLGSATCNTSAPGRRGSFFRGSAWRETLSSHRRCWPGPACVHIGTGPAQGTVDRTRTDGARSSAVAPPYLERGFDTAALSAVFTDGPPRLNLDCRQELKGGGGELRG